MPPPSFSHQTAVVLPRAVQSWLKELIQKIRSALTVNDEIKRHSILSAIEASVEEHAQSLKSAAQADEANHPPAAGPSPTAQIKSQVSLRINDAIQNMLQGELGAQQDEKLPALVDVLFVAMPLLGPTSIVMEWWDLVLHPLLKKCIHPEHHRQSCTRARRARHGRSAHNRIRGRAGASGSLAGARFKAHRCTRISESLSHPFHKPSTGPRDSLSYIRHHASFLFTLASTTAQPLSHRTIRLRRQIRLGRFASRHLPPLHTAHPRPLPRRSGARKPAAPLRRCAPAQRQRSRPRHLARPERQRTPPSRPATLVWKGNLESILLVYSNQKPKEFFHHIAESFSEPTARVPLLFLLSTFLRLYPIHAYHITATALPLMLILSLQLDTSTTCVSLGVTALIMLIPHIPNWIANGGAGGLPTLLSIFARIVDWRRLGNGWETRIGDDPELAELRREKDEEFAEMDRLGKRLNIKPALRWNRLESSFDTTMSSPPNAEHLFTFLYGLFPCNIIRFLRSPVDYLRKASFDSPFEGPWEEMMDEVAVQTRASPILRRHTLHPALITLDAETELTDKQRWLDHDSADINAECLGLFLGKWHDVNPSHIVQAERQRNGSLDNDVPDDESIFSSEARLGPFDMGRRRSAAALMHPSSPSGSAHRHYQRVPHSVNPDDILLTYASLRSGAPLMSATVSAQTPSFDASPAPSLFGGATQPLTAAAQRLDDSIGPTAVPQAKAPSSSSAMTASGTLSRLLPAASAAAAATPAIITAVGSSSASHMSIPASPATHAAHASIARVRSRSGSLSSVLSSSSPSPATPTSPTLPGRHPLASSHLPSDPLTPQPEPREKQALAVPPFAGSSLEAGSSDASIISFLQRENLLLRNELNFELYLKEQHLRHIGRLHREKVTDTALEAERQNLYHTVRTLRTTNAAQHAELERCRAEAASTKARHVQWEADLNNKLRAYREERKAWTSEARELKAQAEEDAAKIATLTRQLEETGAQLFELQTKMEADEPKLAKLEQYEAKIAQLTSCLAYWDNDVLKYEQQRNEMEKLLNKWDEMAYLVESTEATLSEVEQTCSRLEAENERLKQELNTAFDSVKALKVEKGKLVAQAQPGHEQALDTVAELEQQRGVLRDENEALSEKVLELSARIETMQLQHAANGHSTVDGPHGASGLAAASHPDEDDDVPALPHGLPAPQA